jgi:uncharacterized protein YegL
LLDTSKSNGRKAIQELNAGLKLFSNHTTS